MRKIAIILAAILIASLVVAFPGAGQSQKTEAEKAGPDTASALTDAFDVFVRLDTTSRNVYFVFTADSMFEGAPLALEALEQRGLKASFFFTGNFLRDSANIPVIERVIRQGHYVGPHSDRHLLLAQWNRARTPLVSPDSLRRDILDNLAELSRFGIEPEDVTFAIPPFEWCAKEHAHVYRSLGIVPINPTPEIETYRDFTTPDMPEYWTSSQMLRQLLNLEASRGLNGAIIILHLGTQPARTDKLYHHLPALLDTLLTLRYHPHRL